MEEVPQISSAENLLHLYNEYHKTNYNQRELLCYKCNGWNYLASNQTNLCLHEACKVKSSRLNGIRVIEHSKIYPCKFHASGCNVFSSDIVKHEEICRKIRLAHRKAGKPYEKTEVCQCFCNIALSNESIIPHLREKHSMQTTELKEPMVSLTIEMIKMNNANTTTTNLPYHLSAGYTSLIVIVSFDTSSNQFDVIISNITETPRTMSYNATLVYNNIKYSKYDTVYDQFISNSKRDLFLIPNIKDPVILNIYFENYEAIQPLLEYFDTVIKDYECPICMDIIKDSCYHCTNGHNICVKCKRIDRCPTCRATFNTNIISIKRLTPKFLKPCKNAVNGCFIYGREDELVNHERDCPMSNITCEICTTDFVTSGYIVHMTRQHGMKKLDKTPAIIKPGFVFYKGHVFEFIVKNRVIEEETNIVLYKWSIRLINCSETLCNREFEMKIEYSEIITTMKGKVSNNLYQNSFSVNNAAIPNFTLSFQF